MFRFHLERLKNTSRLLRFALPIFNLRNNLSNVAFLASQSFLTILFISPLPPSRTRHADPFQRSLRTNILIWVRFFFFSVSRPWQVLAICSWALSNTPVIFNPFCCSRTKTPLSNSDWWHCAGFLLPYTAHPFHSVSRGTTKKAAAFPIGRQRGRRPA